MDIRNIGNDKIMSTHAEIDAIKKYKCKYKHKNGKNYSKNNISIFVIRVNGNGELKMSKPCKHCHSYILSSSNIKKVYYSDENGNIVCEKVRDMECVHIPKLMIDK